MQLAATLTPDAELSSAPMKRIPYRVVSFAYAPRRYTPDCRDRPILSNELLSPSPPPPLSLSLSLLTFSTPVVEWKVIAGNFFRIKHLWRALLSYSLQSSSQLTLIYSRFTRCSQDMVDIYYIAVSFLGRGTRALTLPFNVSYFTTIIFLRLSLLKIHSS
jgi:hypothetical protein